MSENTVPPKAKSEGFLQKAFVFLAIAAGYLMALSFLWQGYERLRLWSRADELVETEAQILACQSGHHLHSDNKTGATQDQYLPEIELEFHVSGQAHRWKKQFPEAKWEDEANRILEQYPEGGTATVYYDPQNPRVVSLTREISILRALVYLPLGLFLLVCMLIPTGKGIRDVVRRFKKDSEELPPQPPKGASA